MKNEESLQIAVCKYMKLQYPKVLFACDLSSGLKLTMGQAVKAKQMRESRGYPDLIVFSANGGYHGLAIELKKEGTKITRRDGHLIADEHVREQAEVLQRFLDQGYQAGFSIGFEQAKKAIDTYLNS